MSRILNSALAFYCDLVNCLRRNQIRQSTPILSSTLKLEVFLHFMITSFTLRKWQVSSWWNFRGPTAMCMCVLRLYASRLNSRWSRCSCRKKCQVGDTTSPPVLLEREQQKNRTLSSFLQLQRLHNTRWRSQIHIAYWQWHQKWRRGRRQRKRTALNHDQTSKLQKMQQTDHIDIYVI